MAYKALRVAVATMLGLLVAACGGGGGTGGGDVGSTPPPPVASYPRLDSLSAEQKLDTSGYVLKVDDTRVISATPTTADAVTITFQPATGTYLVKTPFAAATSYSAADAVSGSGFPSDGFNSFNKNETVNGVAISNRVSIYRTQGGNGSTGFSVVPLTYTSLLLVVRQTVPGGFSTADLSFSYGGFATTAADMPRTGSASYSGLAFGQYWNNAIGQRTPVEGTFGVTANFAANSLATNMSLNAVNVPLLTFTGNGTIAGSQFNGTLAGANTAAANYAGAFDGQFMGPGAAELGLRFNVSNGSNFIVGVGGARK